MWCEQNPQSKSRREKQSSITKTRLESKRKKFYGPPLTKEERNFIRSIRLKNLHKSGFYDDARKKISEKLIGRKHKKESIEKMRDAALKSDHRRLLKSTREFITKNGEKILLDSSWEEILARRLDHLEISWTRPKDPIIWFDSNGNRRRYFPDFHLTDQDIFLDPKNPAALINQQEKVQSISRSHKNVIFLLNKDECEQFTLHFD